ncbi:MAG: precorrin-6A reductase [Oscillibacter sp.]|nr:precorrin-6A reductase [Oscillibacter sp.]MCI8689241.1 precorrin-6A reductase [Oscillibacter sp.]MCI9481071.1 precorrin-6A reductase [Oscillibacter sp.]
MRVLLFGGTTEGRELSRQLAAEGLTVTVCVATDYGREEQGDFPGVTVLTGRRTVSEMVELLQNQSLCIDATHPYAVAATENIRAACKTAGVPYRRLLREGSVYKGVTVRSAQEAADYLENRPGNVLLATGAKELAAFASLSPERLFPRVLPSHEGLAACEAAGIPHRNIIAMQGPFSQAVNEAVMGQFQISFLVTKDGGKAGGFPEKAAAAEAAGVELVVISRAPETGESYETILQQCREMLP